MLQPSPFPRKFVPSPSTYRLHRPPASTSPPKIEQSPISPFQIDVQDIIRPRLEPPKTQNQKTLADRPDTPLDFLKTTTLKKMDSAQRRRSMSQRADGRSSGDWSNREQKLEVDPRIKGVPQGWEDDLSVKVTPKTTGPIPPRQARSPPPLHSSRLSSFREGGTRAKLVSFTNKVREARDRNRDGDSDHSRLSRKITSATLRRPALPDSASSLPSIHTPSPYYKPRQSSQQVKTTKFPDISLSSTVSRDSHADTVLSRPSTDDSLCVPEISLDTHTGSSSSGFTNLFTPPQTQSANSPTYPADRSSVSSYRAASESSTTSSNRERVMGLRKDPIIGPSGPATQSRIFLSPNVSDVLPFSGVKPFNAWDCSMDPASAKSEDGSTAMTAGTNSRTTELSQSHWKDLPKPRGGQGGKRVWIEDEEEVGGVYRVGWERDVLDLEARLHETMYEIFGGKHTMIEAATEADQPKTVLDIGTGTGLWAISQALEWPETRFVGLDLVPSQTNLHVLANAEKTARSSSSGIADGLGMWGSIAKRVSWDRGNFLEPLPYDTGVFDMVHIRFVGLGVPEYHWGDLLEEAVRVLRRGGKLEIVETSYNLPSSAPTSLHNSFASLLLADLVSPRPSLPIQFNLPSIPSLVPSSLKPVFSETFQTESPGALGDAVMCWVKSALEYKSTSLTRSGSSSGRDIDGGIGRRVRNELGRVGNGKWVFADEDSPAGGIDGSDDLHQGKEKEGRVEGAVSVWAWVACKK